MSEKQIEVSICLPVYNAATFIDDALKSILEQSFENFEVLIADDGSTDNTGEIIHSYAQNDSRIVYWKNEKNQGAVRNYNLAFEKARGIFIKPFAADDIMHKDHLSALLSSIKTNSEIALVSCARQIIDGAGNKSEIASSFSASGRHKSQDIRKECLRRFIHIFNLIGEPSCVLFRKEHASDGFDKNYYHMTDLDKWLQILEKGDLYYHAEPLCFYRKHENTTTSNNFKSLYYTLDFMRIIDKNVELCTEIFGSREEAYLTVVEHLGRFVSDLCDERNVKVPLKTISENLLDQRDPLKLQSGMKFTELKRDRTLTDQEYFRQLALFALVKTGQNGVRLDTTYKEMSAELERCKAELASIYNSTSWKSTKLLRGVSRILKSKA